MRRMGVFPVVITVAVLAMVIFAESIGNSPNRAQAAPPSSYSIAVLDVGSSGDWGDDDFQSLSSNPGVFSFQWEFIQTTELTSSGLAAFNVLIIPWDHDYIWLDQSMVLAVVQWVKAGGTLIIHSVDESGDDALLEGFGPTLAVTWTTNNGEAVVITDASNPLVSSPNVLSDAGLSNWSSSFHSTVSQAGTAWHWATEGEREKLAACAVSGAGSIVVQGQDPEFHGTNGGQLEAFDLIENEITVQRSGICAGKPPTTPVPTRTPRPNVSGAIGGVAEAAAQQARENRARANAAAQAPQGAQVSPPSTGQGFTITPPSTGDAGLLRSSSLPAAYALAVGALAAMGLAVSLRAYRAR